jgi:hypothetical protein
MDLRGLPGTEGFLDAGGEVDLHWYLQATVPVAGAVAVAELLWPEFVEYRGCVVPAFLLDERAVDAWLDEAHAEVPSVEAVLSHLHLWDVFAPSSTTERQALSELAPVIARTWRGALRDAYPDRRFVVRAADEPEEYGPTLWFRSEG